MQNPNLPRSFWDSFYGNGIVLILLSINIHGHMRKESNWIITIKGRGDSDKEKKEEEVDKHIRTKKRYSQEHNPQLNICNYITINLFDIK